MDTHVLPGHIWAAPDISERMARARPLFESVAAGFPSPAEDYMDSRLDLNEYCVERPSATYFMRISGESMRNMGIFDGDMLVVDRALKPRYNDIVVAIVDGDFTVKQLCKRNGLVYLAAANPDYPPIVLSDESDFRVWGVALHVIHRLHK
jgi:DNA polymerase V